MDGLALLRKARGAGLRVAVEGERLVIRGPRAAEALAHALLAHKTAVMAALTGDQANEAVAPEVTPLPRYPVSPEQVGGGSEWPAACLEAERRFGQPHARLFPLIGQVVSTPDGVGVLCQVFHDRAAVVVGVDPAGLALVPADKAPPLRFVIPWCVAPARAVYKQGAAT